MAWKKLVLHKNHAPVNRIDGMFLSETCFGTEFLEFSVTRNGSERNSESLLLFLFHGKEFRAFVSSVERFGTEFREFSVPRNSRNSAGTNQLFRLIRLPRNNFLSEIANPGGEGRSHLHKN